MKKGQAAMEFLMTYGWAILVVLVAIGALAYFGVLSPEKFLPSKCVLPSGIACLDHKADSNGVQIVLKNALGFDVSAVTVTVGGCAAATPADTTLANGGQLTFTAACVLNSGNKFSSDVSIAYTITDTGLTHNKTGSITTTVE